MAAFCSPPHRGWGLRPRLCPLVSVSDHVCADGLAGGKWAPRSLTRSLGRVFGTWSSGDHQPPITAPGWRPPTSHHSGGWGPPSSITARGWGSPTSVTAPGCAVRSRGLRATAGGGVASPAGAPCWPRGPRHVGRLPAGNGPRSRWPPLQGSPFLRVQPVRPVGKADESGRRLLRCREASGQRQDRG